MIFLFCVHAVFKGDFCHSGVFLQDVEILLFCF